MEHSDYMSSADSLGNTCVSQKASYVLSQHILTPTNTHSSHHRDVHFRSLLWKGDFTQDNDKQMPSRKCFATESLKYEFVCGFSQEGTRHTQPRGMRTGVWFSPGVFIRGG